MSLVIIACVLCTPSTSTVAGLDQSSFIGESVNEHHVLLREVFNAPPTHQRGFQAQKPASFWGVEMTKCMEIRVAAAELHAKRNIVTEGEIEYEVRIMGAQLLHAIWLAAS